jgi:hypothetical protein
LINVRIWSAIWRYNRRVETTLNRFPLRFVDSAAVLDEAAKWEKRYADIFGGQPR